MIEQTTNNKRQRGVAKVVLHISLLVTCYLLLVTTAFAQFPSPIATPSPTATPKVKEDQATKSATDEVREKVRQKIENLVKKPRAVVGTLSEVTDSTLQVTNKAGKEDMVATTKDTQYVRVAGSKRTNIKFEDLVIGDFIVAMGYRNGNNILEARRVIAYDKSPLIQRRAVYGVVGENQKGVLTIKHPKTGASWKVKTTSKTKVTKKGDKGFEDIKVADIQNSNRITAAGLPSEKEQNVLTASRIHVIPGKAQGLVGAPKPTKSPSPTPKPSPSPSPAE